MRSKHGPPQACSTCSLKTTPRPAFNRPTDEAADVEPLENRVERHGDRPRQDGPRGQKIVRTHELADETGTTVGGHAPDRVLDEDLSEEHVVPDPDELEGDK